MRAGGWAWSILRPVLIVGDSVGSAMNVIPALGVYAALMRRAGKTRLDYPGGTGRVAQAVDADLLGARHRLVRRVEQRPQRDLQRHQWRRLRLAQCLAGDRRRPGLRGGRVRAAGAGQGDPPAGGGLGRGLRGARPQGGVLEGFVGLSFEYADYTMGYGRDQPGPAAIVSTIKLMQAGFCEVIDTEAMFRKAFAEMQAKRLLPPR